ncbi:MAG: hypothetical protein FWD36_05665, partial [Treponema sp.]|nr:hypothetical protein [Treponema sp.]
MPANIVTVNAIFEPIPADTYAINKGTFANGDFTISPPGPVTATTPITLTPTANTNFRFVQFTFSPAGPTATETAPGSGIYTFNMPANAVTVNATFERVYTITKGNYTNGDVIINPEGPASVGTTITLTPAPNSGYRFGTFSFTPGAAGVTATETAPGSGIWTFTMPSANITVNATFTAIPTYAINKTAPVNGDFTISPTGPAAAGALITLTPSAALDYRFSHFTITPGSLNVTATETAPGSGIYTFTMPAGAVTIAATFVPTRFAVIKGAHANGDFTISPAEPATENTVITLTPTANSNYRFSHFAITPSSVTATETASGSGIWTFSMPDSTVTVAAYFLPLENQQSGTKTMTVVGGVGKPPVGSSPVRGDDNWGGTRHITVTVTLTNNVITGLVYDDPISYNYTTTHIWYAGRVGNAEFKTQSVNLCNAIRTANNPDVAFTPGSFGGAVNGVSGTVADAWAIQAAAIRQAVKDAIFHIQAGMPNRTLAGGGANPWTVNGSPLSGEATITGTGFMSGTGVATSGSAPTDMTVRVAVNNGIITEVVSSNSDDLNCTWRGNLPDNIQTSVGTSWPNQVRTANNWDVLDAVSGATNPGAPISRIAMRNIIKLAIEKIANEY